ncbi:pyridoxamine 5'-phosphate oxidase family protein [Geomonas sp.]|uniref:pyridoxamine 5'-phosphate oxidase family protein n=1 Tax=Geomonas sp. TaxID=2651584 RepID=UPI002B46D58A|nr:pyridoxamine 5'-phosphate oxidase family protein [Geomonas sp.]HJV37094.1 pyridoxamine 5'-phosphate oxidase family protein [Geomonas sp.]
MLTEGIKSFAEGIGHAYVATSDADGNPHLAAGRGLAVTAPNRLAFEAWFCPTTMRNLKDNPKVAVAIADPSTGNGYQFIGRVERAEDTALLDGYLPDAEPPGLPQVQWRLEVKVESVLAFTADAHSDRPLG